MLAILLQVYPLVIAVGGALIWIVRLQWDLSYLKSELKSIKVEQSEDRARNGNMLSDIRERLVRIETLLEQKDK
jgi:hypothetical protein